MNKIAAHIEKGECNSLEYALISCFLFDCRFYGII